MNIPDRWLLLIRDVGTKRVMLEEWGPRRVACLPALFSFFRRSVAEFTLAGGSFDVEAFRARFAEDQVGAVGEWLAEHRGQVINFEKVVWDIGGRAGRTWRPSPAPLDEDHAEAVPPR